MEISNEGHAAKKSSAHSSVNSCASRCRRQHLRSFAYICGKKSQWSRQPLPTSAKRFVWIHYRLHSTYLKQAWVCIYWHDNCVDWRALASPKICVDKKRFVWICEDLWLKYQWLRQPLPKATFAFIFIISAAFGRAFKQAWVSALICTRFALIYGEKYQWFLQLNSFYIIHL